MSLLMEALKKAEEAKRLAAEGSNNLPEAPVPQGLAGLTLEPLTPAVEPASEPTPTSTTTQATRAPSAGSNSPLPDLAKHLDSVDADLAAVSTTQPIRKRTPADLPRLDHAEMERRAQAERSAARAVFTAKVPPAKSKAPLWAFLSLTVIATLGLGGYFWWQLQSYGGSSMARPTNVPPTPTSASVAVQTVPAGLPPAIPSSAIPDTSPAVPTAATPANTTETSKPVAASVPTRAETPAFEPLLKPTPKSKAPAEGSLRLSASRQTPNQTLNHAYDDLQADRLSEAQRGYEQVLRQDSRNTDALLGLATIAARQGQAERAQSLYLRVLEADPNDAYALASLTNLRSGQGETGLSESRLKNLLSAQPDSAALHFALGNVFARQQRWGEAQQSFFRAYALDAENADYLFNLAVALDNLHQGKLAARYYEMALATAEKRSVSFDRIQAKTRLLELRP